jgi:hypothetical protein
MWEGSLALIAVLAATTVFGLLWRRRQGKLRAVPGTDVLTAADLGAPLGQRATLVQFSTEFCTRCGPTRKILAEVADGTDGVALVEIDAAARLDLARRLRVQATPTVLVLGPDGAVTRRAVGQPSQADLVQAIGLPYPTKHTNNA